MSGRRLEVTGTSGGDVFGEDERGCEEEKVDESSRLGARGVDLSRSSHSATRQEQAAGEVRAKRGGDSGLRR